MSDPKKIVEDDLSAQPQKEDPDAVMERNVRYLQALELRKERGAEARRELNTRIFALPPELQGEILSYLDPIQAKEWLWFRPTYGEARARYWKDGIMLGSQAEIVQFCDFIAADRSQNVRNLIQELTLPITEPVRAPVPLHKPIIRGRLTDLGYYIEASWRDLIPRVEAMLAELGGLKTLIIRTVRPDRMCSPIGTTQLIKIQIPDGVETLKLSEPAPTYDTRCYPNEEEAIVSTPGTHGNNTRSSSNIRLVIPGRGLKSLIFSSGVRAADPEDEYYDHGHGGGGMGLDDLPSYASINTLSLQVGNDARNTDPIADARRLLRNLQSLTNLHTLELMSYPYPRADRGRQAGTQEFPTMFTRAWLTALPSLRVLRVPIRNILEYVSTTWASNHLRLELIIVDDELRLPLGENWYDWQFFYVFVRLAEECAHYFSQNSSDKRSLRLRFVEDRSGLPLYMVNMSESWYNSLPPWYSDINSMVYYPAVPYYEMYHDEGSMYGLKDHFERFWSAFVTSMPGFSIERGDLAVNADTDVYKAFQTIGKWELRRNLGIKWKDEVRYKEFLRKLGDGHGVQDD